MRRNFVLASSGHVLVRPLVGFCYLVAGLGNLQLVDRVSALLNAPDVARPPMIYAGSSATDSLKRFRICTLSTVAAGPGLLNQNRRSSLEDLYLSYLITASPFLIAVGPSRLERVFCPPHRGEFDDERI
jgi:hypothetical protein